MFTDFKIYFVFSTVYSFLLLLFLLCFWLSHFIILYENDNLDYFKVTFVKIWTYLIFFLLNLHIIQVQCVLCSSFCEMRMFCRRMTQNPFLSRSSLEEIEYIPVQKVLAEVKKIHTTMSICVHIKKKLKWKVKYFKSLFFITKINMTFVKIDCSHLS